MHVLTPMVKYIFSKDSYRLKIYFIIHSDTFINERYIFQETYSLEEKLNIIFYSFKLQRTALNRVIALITNVIKLLVKNIKT